VFVAHTRDSLIESNLIESPCARKPIREKTSFGIEVPGHAIFLAVTENVTVSNNVVSQPTEYCPGEVGYGPMVTRSDNSVPPSSQIPPKERQQ
jgi:hypothetical protein